MSEEEAYWGEWVNLRMRRIQVLCLVGACILALKHPENQGAAAEVMRNLCRGLFMIVDGYLADEVRAEWKELLYPAGEEGVG